MEGVRRAALCLHALSRADQKWFLRRLPPEQAAIVRALLKELKVMCIPKDRELVRLITADDTHVLAAGSAERQRAAPRLAQADAGEVGRLLDREPRGIVAAILACGEWPWARAYLKSRESMLRSWLTGRAKSLQGQLPTGVRVALIGILEERLETTPAAQRQRGPVQEFLATLRGARPRKRQCQWPR